MKTTFGEKTVELIPADDNYAVTIDEKTISVQVLRTDALHGQMTLLIEGQQVTAYVSKDGAKRWVTVDGRTMLLTKTSGAKQGVRHEYAGGLIAPMPGQVRSVAVGVGDLVKKSQTLLVIEAMKMEIRIQALKDGEVSALFVQVGQTVERGQVLIEIVDTAVT